MAGSVDKTEGNAGARPSGSKAALPARYDPDSEIKLQVRYALRAIRRASQFSIDGSGVDQALDAAENALRAVLRRIREQA
jgi:hypothetical protein